MSTDLSREPDYDRLLEALISKTKEGKLHWEETADENQLVCAVRGQRTFSVNHNPRTNEHYVLVFGPQGKSMFTIPETILGQTAELYRLATRVATNLDERIDESLQLLEQL